MQFWCETGFGGVAACEERTCAGDGFRFQENGLQLMAKTPYYILALSYLKSIPADYAIMSVTRRSKNISPAILNSSRRGRGGTALLLLLVQLLEVFAFVLFGEL